MGKVPIDLSSVSTVGLDLAKHVFFVHAVDDRGQVILAREVRRRDLLSFFASLPACLVGVEACSSAHHWGRELVALGHDDRATLYGAFLTVAAKLRSDDREQALVLWKRKGKRAFEAEANNINDKSNEGRLFGKRPPDD